MSVQMEGVSFPPVTHLIFDMDGLLLDNIQMYINMNQEVLSDLTQKQFTYEDSAAVNGRTPLETAEIIVRRMNLTIGAEEYLKRCQGPYKRCMENIKLMPGVERLVKHLHAHGIPIAIATGSPKWSFDLKMSQRLAFTSYFDVIVTGDQVARGKPAPDIFLEATKRFKDQPKPEECLVFEDSPNGVQAAVASNMRVVMIPDPRTPEEDRQGATLVLDSMEEFKPEFFGLPAYR